ncbi:hypothetical protein BSNK01_02000 [Bacillaceae bacterium]
MKVDIRKKRKEKEEYYVKNVKNVLTGQAPFGSIKSNYMVYQIPKTAATCEQTLKSGAIRTSPLAEMSTG